MAAQPFIPFSPLHLLTEGKRGRGREMGELSASDSDIAAARDRLQTENRRLLALRCRQDYICPEEKITRLKKEFASNLDVIELDLPESEPRPRFAHI